MSEGHASGPEVLCTGEWVSLVGTVVDVYLHDDFHRRGIVEDVMQDSSGLWIAAQSPYSREFIDKASGYTVWTEHWTLPNPAATAAPGVIDQMPHTAFAASA